MLRTSLSGLGLTIALVLTGCGDDGGPDDAGGIDGGGIDSGGTDAGGIDSGGVDGGGVDGGGTDGGGVDATADAPVSWPDSGSELPPPEWAALTVGPAGSCDALTPCGGDVVGTWDVSGGCFEVDIESAISMCPGAMVTRREGRGRGRVVFRSDGFAHRVADAEVEADLFVPEICARFYSCAMIEAAMASFVTSASCTTEMTGDCNCTARQVTHIDDADAYTIEGNEIVSSTSGKRWQYCIEGDVLRYQDTSPSGPMEPGIPELTRR